MAQSYFPLRLALSTVSDVLCPGAVLSDAGFRLTALMCFLLQKESVKYLV